jgi:hypothetical protein
MPEGESEHLKKYGITPKERARQAQTTGRLIEEGAEYNENAVLIPTEKQKEMAKLEMKGEKIARDEIFSYAQVSELIRLVGVEARHLKDSPRPADKQEAEGLAQYEGDVDEILKILQNAKYWQEKWLRGEK